MSDGADPALREGLAPTGDRMIGFTVPGRDVRGRFVRLDTTLAAILAAHAYPPTLARLLGEALALTALLGASLRPDGGETGADDSGSLTLQAQAKGPVELLVCDWKAGQLRGYLAGDLETRPGSLEQMFGPGHLAVSLDATRTATRYQGIVPLEGASLTAAIEEYFRVSEQVPTLIRTGMVISPLGDASVGGLLLQYLPRGEDGGTRLFAADEGQPEPPDWRHVRALAGTITAAELADPALEPEALLWRLFHEEEVRLFPGVAPSRGCRCSPAHIEAVLTRFPETERAEMRSEDGLIAVDCKFCSRVWKIAA